MLVGMLCSSILFTGLVGGLKVSASEVDNNKENSIEIIEKSDNLKPTRAGTINGVYYRVMIRTGNVKPRPIFNGMRLVLTQRNNGVYYGYYR